MLHDFTFRSPDEVLAELMGTSVAAAKAVEQEVAPRDDRHEHNGPQPKSDPMANMSAGNIPSLVGGNLAWIT